MRVRHRHLALSQGDPVQRAPHPGTGARPERSAGFSLVELMLVAGVIAMMATVISMSMDTLLPKERLNTAVRNLSGELRTVRSEAISRSLEYFIEYDIENDRYRRLMPFSVDGEHFNAEEDDDETRFKGPWNDLPPGVEIAQVAINGVLYDSQKAFIRFDPRGAASDHQVVLSQPRYENFYTVEVLALTGTFKFHRGVYVREAPDDRDFE